MNIKQISGSMDYQIIYEDESLVAVNKAIGVSAIPGRGMQDSISLLDRLSEKYGQKLYTVHRLDKDTSGVIVFARSAVAHRSLSMQFERRETKKIYFSVVSGIITEPFSINQPIYEFGSGRMGVDNRGKPSETIVSVKEIFPRATYLEVSPVTGRRHQIRVHLYWAAHPVLGDTLYGSPRPVGNISRLMLHAYQLGIRHPDGNYLVFNAQPDEHWEEIITSLRNASS